MVQQQGHGFGARAALVDEMQRQALPVHAELAELIHCAFLGAPIKVIAPVVDQLTQIGAVETVLPIVVGVVVGMAGAKSSKQTVYDPTCGSGSLLLKAAAEAPHGVTIYGQEMDNATSALAKMNMILHDCPTAEIWKDNTLSTPYFKNGDSLMTFDFAVANPPFSTKAWSNGFNPQADEFHRFDFGIPPAKNGDYAFLLHILV